MFLFCISKVFKTTTEILKMVLHVMFPKDLLLKVKFPPNN